MRPFDYGSLDLPVGFGLQISIRGCGSRITVIDKHHTVPDKDIVFNGDAFADEGVTGDLAAPADAGILLDLNKCSNLRFIADLASVEVDELG